MEFNNNIFGGYEYAFIETRATWAVHKEAAITRGGHLASVHLDGKNKCIAKRILELKLRNTWIGGQRISNNPIDGSAKAWKWSDGTNWECSVWNPGEPNQDVFTGI